MADELGIELPKDWKIRFEYIKQHGATGPFGPVTSDKPITAKGLTPVLALSNPKTNETLFFKGSADAFSGRRPVSFDGSETRIMPVNLTPSESAVWTLGHEMGWLTGGAINDAHANGFGFSAVERFRGL